MEQVWALQSPYFSDEGVKFSVSLSGNYSSIHQDDQMFTIFMMLRIVVSCSHLTLGKILQRYLCVNLIKGLFLCQLARGGREKQLHILFPFSMYHLVCLFPDRSR